MQFGVKPLFENISVKFRDGNRYGLIGANGSGKSTFMKILDGSQTPSSGQIIIDSNQRIGKLNQNQFEFEVTSTNYQLIFQKMTLTRGRIREAIKQNKQYF